MIKQTFRFNSKDNTSIHVYKWLPDDKRCKAIVQIVHGMAEHAGRYETSTRFLFENGYGVYANDLRGHGKTVTSNDDLGYLGKNKTFNDLLQDVYGLTEIIKANHPGLPVFLFGHSLGVFIALGFIENHGNAINGCIFSGPGFPNKLFVYAGKIIAKGEIKKHGEKHHSQKANELTFGAYNKPFKPNRTPFDWLNRNNDEVDTYIKDPLCGFICTSSFYLELSKWVSHIFKKKNTLKIPGTLPLFLISGEKDPVGNMGKDIKKLYTMLKKSGIKDISKKIYAQARHEIINELNKKETAEDILSWLEAHLK